MLIGEEGLADSVAVIGGGAMQAFKMGNSAHAFRALSDTLYSNKKRAVVREILCNAIDAHIMAGTPDLPVEVELTDGALRVTDRGPGIPHSEMANIYATYFGTTKRDDAAQTGGFGLGSKSPFAYTDHFIVTNAHAGVRGVYAAHIADEESDGAPALRQMGSMACETTGVTVEVPLSDPKDKDAFAEEIKSVAQEGGMRVRLNGIDLTTIDYSELRKAGYGAMRSVDYRYRGGILVLFGNVLYHVPRIEDFIEPSQVRHIREALDLPYGQMIFHAPPCSVVPVPSREALSMTPKTIATLAKIARRAAHEIQARIGPMLRHRVYEIVSKVERDEYADRLDYQFRSSDMLAKGEALLTGASGVAKLIVNKRVNQFQFPFKLILQGNRRLKREPIRMCRGSSGHTWPTSSLARQFRYDITRRVHEKLLKVVGAAGALHLLRYRSHEKGRAQTLKSFYEKEAKIDSYAARDRGSVFIAEPKIILVETADTIYQTKAFGFVLVERHLKAGQIAALRAEAAKRDIEIIEVRRPVAKIDVIHPPGHKLFIGPLEDKSLFRPARGLSASELVIHKPLRTIAKPKYFLEPESWEDWIAACGGAGMKAVRTGLSHFYPDVALCLNDKDHKALLAAGATPIEDKILADAKARAEAKVDVDQLAMVIVAGTNGNFQTYEQGRSWCGINLAARIMRHDRALGLSVIDRDARDSPELQEAVDFWRLAAGILIYRGWSYRRREKATVEKRSAVFRDEVCSLVKTYSANHRRFQVRAKALLSELIDLDRHGSMFERGKGEWAMMLVRAHLDFKRNRKERKHAEG